MFSKRILNFLIALVVVALAVWAVEALVPMDFYLRRVLQVVVIVVVVVAGLKLLRDEVGE